MSIDRWVGKDMVCMYVCMYRYTHTHNGILAIKKDEIMPFAAT